MKKLVITTAIVLGLGLTTFAQGGSMFHREYSGDNGTSLYKGMNRENDGNSVNMPGLPTHGANDSQNAPLGSGIALLTAFGAAYLVGKRRKED